MADQSSENVCSGLTTYAFEIYLDGSDISLPSNFILDNHVTGFHVRKKGLGESKLAKSQIGLHWVIIAHHLKARRLCWS